MDVTANDMSDLYRAKSELPPTSHVKLLTWVEKARKLCEPDQVYWCTGSKEEGDTLCNKMVENGTFIRLNPKYRPGSFLARTDPRDLNKFDERTFICSNNKEDAGPTNNWMEPNEMKSKLEKLFHGSMQGRTMFIVPFCMGPLGSKWSKFGVIATDSPYVVMNVRTVTRVGTRVSSCLDS